MYIHDAVLKAPEEAKGVNEGIDLSKIYCQAGDEYCRDHDQQVDKYGPFLSKFINYFTLAH